MSDKPVVNVSSGNGTEILFAGIFIMLGLAFFGRGCDGCSSSDDPIRIQIIDEEFCHDDS